MVDTKKTTTKKTTTKATTTTKAKTVNLTPAPKDTLPSVPAVEENVTPEPSPGSRVSCRRRG